MKKSTDYVGAGRKKPKKSGRGFLLPLSYQKGPFLGGGVLVAVMVETAIY